MDNPWLFPARYIVSPMVIFSKSGNGTKSNMDALVWEKRRLIFPRRKKNLHGYENFRLRENES